MRRRAIRSGEAGFLLAEMLTTLTISAFVLAGLVGFGAVLYRAANRSVAVVDGAEDLGRTLASLDGLIRMAARARLDGAENQPFLFNGDDRRLMIAHRDTTLGALPVTRVVALRSDNGRLLRADAALPARIGALGELNFGPPRVIYAGGARLRFAYVGAPLQSGGDAPSVAAWPTGGSMPSAVTLEARDGATGRVLMQTRAMIAADADLGCLVDGACGRSGSAAPPAAPASRLTAAAPAPARRASP